MLITSAVDILCIPLKYTRPCPEPNKIEIIAHRSWIRNLRKYHRVGEFVYHEKYSDDEVLSLFKQGESLGPGWCHCVISVIQKHNKKAIPLPCPRVPTKHDSQLSFYQILQYVNQANYKNLWKDAYKKYSYGCWKGEWKETGNVELVRRDDVVRETIRRLYGVHVFRLGESGPPQEPLPPAHPNLLPAILAIETHQSFLIIQEADVGSCGEGTVQEMACYAGQSLTPAGQLLILYQLLQLGRHLRDLGLVLGRITLSDIRTTPHLWISVSPQVEDSVVEVDHPDAANQDEPPLPTTEDGDCQELAQLCLAWARGAISNYDYLMALNRLANRSLSDPTRHYIMPWVSDLSFRSGSNWRDLSKSKFRLNKGDAQLDLTYNVDPSSNQVPHHVPEVLSEITYYVYMCRVTPKSVLCRHVRSSWVPAEYPASVSRLYQWTPDEAIPQLYSDPSMFKSIHSDLGDLEVPGWASSAQDFVSQHRSMLESNHVSANLHHWIDLNFGFKLCGEAAVKAKNVMLPSGNGGLRGRSGVVQLLSAPHPRRALPSPSWGKVPPQSYPPSHMDSDDDCASSGPDDEGATHRRSHKSSRHGSANFDRDSWWALSQVEALHGLAILGKFDPGCKHPTLCGEHSPSLMDRCKRHIAAVRVRDINVLGCLMVEMCLPEEARMLGTGVRSVSFARRLAVCRAAAVQRRQHIPKFLQPLISALLEESDSSVDNYGRPTVSIHQLLQPLLSPAVFSPLMPLLYSTLLAIRSLVSDASSTPRDSHDGILMLYRNLDTSIRSIHVMVEKLSEDGGQCLKLLVPYFKDLLADPMTDVIAAWYLFDSIAKGLGPGETYKELLEPMLRLYNWDRACITDSRLLHKRVKLYHRSFLLKLTVRFGLQVFLESFTVPLVEAVGGCHDLDNSACSTHFHCSGGEDCKNSKMGVDDASCEVTSPLSPLDLSSHSDSLMPTVQPPSVPDAHSEETEEESEGAVRSATSLHDLLIDAIEPSDLSENIRHDDLESGRIEARRWDPVPAPYATLHDYPESLDHAKYVVEVCEVSGDSVCWLAARLGPLLTATALSRNLLRMLALCYTGPEALRLTGPDSVAADVSSAPVLQALISIAGLYGEQVVVVQYVGHAAELLAHCRKRLTAPFEGGIIASLHLVTCALDLVSDATFATILQEGVVRGVIEPSLRLLGSLSSVLPSGVVGRQALAAKLVKALNALVTRAEPSQRIPLLQTLSRFFLAFSKARDLSPDAPRGADKDGGNNSEESPPISQPTLSAADSSKVKVLEELRETLSPELAYRAYIPFASFFGETLMQQSLRNFNLIKQLCHQYSMSHSIPDGSDAEEIETPIDTESHVGSFGNVVLVGNRLDIQDSMSSSPSRVDDSSPSNKIQQNLTRHLKGNWAAYWEHELGRSSKPGRLDIKQIRLQTFTGHTHSVRHIVPLPSENSFMSSSRDKTVRLWSLRSQGDGSASCGPQWMYTGHRKSVLGCCLNERARLAVSTDSVIHVWDPWVGRPLLPATPPSAPPVNALLALPPPSPLVLCATTDAVIRPLDLRTNSFVSQLKVGTSAGLIRTMVVSPNGSWLAVGQASGAITVLDSTSGMILSQWKAHDAEILQLVAYNDQTLISSSLDQTVSVWNATGGRSESQLKGCGEPVHCLNVCEGDVICGTTTNRLGVHTNLYPGPPQFSSARLRQETFKGVLTSIAVLPLNKLLLLGADSGNITLIC